MNDNASTTLNLIDQLLAEATTTGRPREIDAGAFVSPLSDQTQRHLPAVRVAEREERLAPTAS